jgi:hypothetical protein
MAGRRQLPKNAGDQAWRTQWPQTNDLKTWLRAMIEKCEAIPNDDDAASKALLPIENLAEKGSIPEALNYVDLFLRRLPKENVLATVRMAELGAKICLDAGDVDRTERYLAAMASTEPFNTRKCDKGYSLNAVRKFRAKNGLLNPGDAKDNEERYEAEFQGASRRCKLAKAAGDFESARAAVAEMEKIARGARDEWRQRFSLQWVAHCHAQLKNAEAALQSVRGLDETMQREVLNPQMLINLGMKEDGVARAEQEIARELDGLRETTDPNVHFPVMAIGRWLEFLVAQGAKEKARSALDRTLKEMQNWPVLENGWIPSGVYQLLAQAVAAIGGPTAAEQLLKQSLTEAKAEKRSDWRKGAIDAALDLKAELGQLDGAIAEARKLRSPTQRRKTLGKLLARASRWTELQDVLSQVASPDEAADVAWWIKFELPGGEPRDGPRDL